VDRRSLDAKNDPETQRDEARELGVYTKARLLLVPIRLIIPKPVWNPGRYEEVRRHIERGTPLDPLDVVDKGGKFDIVDGIHRYNASKDLGFTHVPVLVEESVPAPELYEPPEPEKRRLRLGAWVKLREPSWGFLYGWVGEHLGSMRHKGVRRHRYGLNLINESVSQDVADFADDEFDPTRTVPAAIRRARQVVDRG